jgi:hypothetical protein
MVKELTLEADIERAACRFAFMLGVDSPKLVLASQASWPDRTFLYRGRVMFIEFKQKGKKPTPLQEMRLKQLRDQGFRADVCDDLESAKQLIQEFKKYADDNQ